MNIQQLKKQCDIKILRLIFYTLVIMGSILAVLINSHNYYRDIVIKSQQENILNIVTAASSQLEQYFSLKEHHLREILKDLELQQEFAQLANGEKENINLIDLLYRLGKNEYIAIELIDRDGDILKVYTDYNDYEYKEGEDIAKAIRTHKDVYFIDVFGNQSINITQAVKSDDELLGFVRVKIDSDYIYHVYLADYQLNQKGYISLKDNQGRLFLHPSMKFIGEEVVHARKQQYPNYDWSELEENVRRQINKETGVGIYHSIWPGDDTRVKKLNGFTFADIGDTFIILNFSADYKETMVSFEGITNATIAIAILLIITSLIIIIYIYRVEMKKNEIVLESIYFNELKEKNALIMHQSKFAAMGEMLAAIAHQLKQPLNALKISLYNIEDYYNYKENNEEYLNILLRSNYKFVDKISKTIDDFKYFFKPQDEDQIFNIYDAIEFAIELNMSRINELEIKVDIYGDKQLKINGESNIFSQVVLNLLNNSIDALKEIKENKSIKIYIEDKKTEIIIQIIDNGGGIKKEVIENLWKPYVTTKGNKGTGLGLYISRYIIKEKFNGELVVENVMDGVKGKIIIPKEKRY
ncbi:sensor histidine kinase [Alkalithermobacter paradoxus]|uniref:histidine kinase n=1 Tax=Alkalithermobacter paradoxus TaxID=29349 RepID=A0A1V4I8Y2_9FIRM|nr:sensor protein ZraS [[Clostridium] thermoalcaliphilum]